MLLVLDVEQVDGTDLAAAGTGEGVRHAGLGLAEADDERLLRSIELDRVGERALDLGVAAALARLGVGLGLALGERDDVAGRNPAGTVVDEEFGLGRELAADGRHRDVDAPRLDEVRAGVGDPEVPVRLTGLVGLGDALGELDRLAGVELDCEQCHCVFLLVSKLLNFELGGTHN